MNQSQLQTIQTELNNHVQADNLKNIFITPDAVAFEIITPKTHGQIRLDKHNLTNFYLKLEPMTSGVISGGSANLSELLHVKLGVLNDRFALQNQQPLNFSGMLNQHDDQLVTLKQNLAEKTVPNIDTNATLYYQNDIELILTQRYNQSLLIQLSDLFNQFNQNPIEPNVLKNKINKGIYKFIHAFKTGDNWLHQLYERTKQTDKSLLSPTTLHQLLTTSEVIAGLQSYLNQIGYFDKSLFNAKTLAKLNKQVDLDATNKHNRNQFQLWTETLFKFITNTQRSLVDFYRTKQPESHDNKMSLGHYYYQNILKLI